MTQEKRYDRGGEGIDVEFDPEVVAEVEDGARRETRPEAGSPIEGLGPSGSVGLPEAASRRDLREEDPAPGDAALTSDMASRGNPEAGDAGVPGGYAAADAPVEPPEEKNRRLPPVGSFPPARSQEKSFNMSPKQKGAPANKTKPSSPTTPDVWQPVAGNDHLGGVEIAHSGRAYRRGKQLEQEVLRKEKPDA